jgi:hypothetical protein
MKATSLELVEAYLGSAHDHAGHELHIPPPGVVFDLDKLACNPACEHEHDWLPRPEINAAKASWLHSFGD